MRGGKARLEDYRSGQRLLERQRFRFPQDWLYLENAEGEWVAFSEILARKEGALKDQVAPLQIKILAEDRALAQRVDELLVEWDREKPVQGDLNCTSALQTLTVFDGRLQRANDDCARLDRAKRALGLELGEGGSGPGRGGLAALRSVSGLSGVGG